MPNRTTSQLYTPAPQVTGLTSLKVNGKQFPEIKNGYAVIRRTWKKGDKVDVVLPMQVQQITADTRIDADKGRVALRYGPLIYNVESSDGQDITQAIGSTPLTIEWKPDLLKGVITIKGTWADGSPLLAIPNFTRLNRLQPTPLPANSTFTQPSRANEPPQPVSGRVPVSIVWIKK